MTFEGEIRDDAEVFGNDGHKIGRVGQVFVQEGTDDPTWIAVQTGLFGMQHSFVPVAGATMRGGELVVAYDKQFVKDAPRIADAEDLTLEQEAELYRYYDVEPPRRAAHGTSEGGADHAAERGQDGASETQRVDGLPHDERGTHDASTHEHGSALPAVGQHAATGAGPGLRRRVVTEMQTVQVPVQREEIVVEGEGIAPDADERDRR